MAAAADRDSRPSTEPKLLPLLIHNFKITFDANRSIAENRHFCSCHEFLRVMTTKWRRASRLQDSEGDRGIQERQRPRDLHLHLRLKKQSSSAARKGQPVWTRIGFHHASCRLSETPLAAGNRQPGPSVCRSCSAPQFRALSPVRERAWVIRRVV